MVLDPIIERDSIDSLDSIPAISHGPFTATPIGLIIEENVPFKLWLAYGGALRRVEKSLQWIIGDWINYGEMSYGEIYAQAEVMWPGMTKERLIRYAWVARAVPRYLRKHDLSWSHHVEVAKLDRKKQFDLLKTAIKEDLTVRELRDRVDNRPQRSRIVCCPKCHHEFGI